MPLRLRAVHWREAVAKMTTKARKRQRQATAQLLRMRSSWWLAHRLAIP
ncbi:hypothetical protein [Streptomyces sp. NPDC007988]